MSIEQRIPHRLLTPYGQDLYTTLSRELGVPRAEVKLAVLRWAYSQADHQNYSRPPAPKTVRRIAIRDGRRA